MLSTEFTSYPIASIFVDRSVRQRTELTALDELAASIREVGLMHPIIITREGTLVAGERRLEAHKLLGYDSILVRFSDTLDPLELHLIELEENIKRVELPWQDRTRAIAEYHRLKVAINPEQTVLQTATELGQTPQSINQHIAVAAHMDTDEVVASVDTFSAARNHVTRKMERKKTSALADLDLPAPARRGSVSHLNFLEWSKQPQTVPFNLIHCDFPYGVSTGDKKKGQATGTGRGTYADSEDIYMELLEAFLARQDNFIAPQAHCLFWLSMNYWQHTRDRFAAHGWQLCPFPLIWGKSDNTGILADPMRLPRNIAEFALLASRGDRKIVRSVGNVFWGPTTKQFHPAEKSLTMLQHFFRMLVDETTVMLDPTCGSGMAVRAAESAGARLALGLEQDKEFYERACENMRLAYESETAFQDHIGDSNAEA